MLFWRLGCIEVELYLKSNNFLYCRLEIIIRRTIRNDEVTINQSDDKKIIYKNNAIHKKIEILRAYDHATV